MRELFTTGSEVFMDGPVVVEVIEDCGCILRTHPDESWTDSGCGQHMPHWSGQGDGVEWEDIEGSGTPRPRPGDWQPHPITGKSPWDPRPGEWDPRKGMWPGE